MKCSRVLLVAGYLTFLSAPAGAGTLFIACKALPEARQAIALSPIIVVDDRTYESQDKAEIISKYEAENGVPLHIGGWGGKDVVTEFIYFKGDPAEWGKSGDISGRDCFKSASKENLNRWFQARKNQPNATPWVTGTLKGWTPSSPDFIRFEDWPPN